jgi:thioredoxin 2
MRQLVCHACNAVNRMPLGKDASEAKCGRCGDRLFVGHPIEVSGEEFAAHRRSTQGLALLVDVWAPWCGPCRMMAPHFEKAAARLEPNVRLLKLNSEDEPPAAAELQVSGIPTLLLFRDGQLVARQAGAMSADQIVAWTTQALAKAAA